MSSFSRKPLLVRQGTKLFFVEDARRAEFESRPGKRWGKPTHAHFCAGQFFTVEADGTCRACRKGGNCLSVKVKVLDITHATVPRIPDTKRPPRPDDIAERREIDLATLPERKLLRLNAFVERITRERGLSRIEQVEIRARLCKGLGVGGAPPRSLDEAFAPMLAELGIRGTGRASRRDVSKSSLRACSNAELDAQIEAAALELNL